MHLQGAGSGMARIMFGGRPNISKTPLITPPGAGAYLKF